MPDIILHKVLVDEYTALMYAMYADDRDLLSTFGQNAGQALDLCVSSKIAAIPTGSKFYKIEMPDGTLIGYFTLSIVSSFLTSGMLYLRRQFRTDIFNKLVNDLISSSINNKYVTSIGASNFA